jgi:hypothetical protein
LPYLTTQGQQLASVILVCVKSGDIEHPCPI